MNETSQYLVEEFLDEYRAERLSRRSMLRRVSLIMGSAVAAATWLQSQGLQVSANEAQSAASQPIPPDQVNNAITIDPNDPSILAGNVEFAARDGVTLYGYIARPAGQMEGARFPGLIITHENTGIQEHFRDVARRYAKEGFVAMATDLYSRQGGTSTAADTAAVNAGLSGTSPDQHSADLGDYAGYVMSQSDVVPGGVGATGFCFGGGRTWRVALDDSRILTSVPYYGAPIPALDRIPDLKGPVFAIYGALDERLDAGVPALEDALKSAGKTYKIRIYDNAPHAFFNDSKPVYAQAAATEAWSDTLAWFRQYLPTA